MKEYSDFCNASMKEFEGKTGIEMSLDHQNLYRLAYYEAATTWHKIGKAEGWDSHIKARLTMSRLSSPS